MSFVGLIPIVFLYAFIGNITYGIIVSLIVDYVSEIFNLPRVVLSGTIYLIAGFIAMFIIINGLGIYAVLCMISFFVMDEYFRFKKVFYQSN